MEFFELFTVSVDRVPPAFSWTVLVLSVVIGSGWAAAGSWADRHVPERPIVEPPHSER